MQHNYTNMKLTLESIMPQTIHTSLYTAHLNFKIRALEGHTAMLFVLSSLSMLLCTNATMS